MSTIIYPSPIFGPVHSRRLGVSLGINLMPADGKICTFDCIYCECGFNADHRPTLKRPTREEVSTALEARLRRMKDEGVLPDVLTFAGNGEPTLNPKFPEIVDDVIRLRDRLCPEAKISVLSNSTQIHRPEVRQALLRTDNPIMKLDTVQADYIRLVDRPQGHYDVERIIEHLAEMSPKVIIQTMFMKGPEAMDNTEETYVGPWLEALQRIRPRQVMVYTLDRETPVQGLEKASPQRLDEIADRVRAIGLDCMVSY